MWMRLTGGLVFYRHRGGGDNYTRYGTEYYESCRGKKIISSILLLVQDFQNSRVIRYTDTELKEYRLVLNI
jgi:hypothetical protein